MNRIAALPPLLLAGFVWVASGALAFAFALAPAWVSVSVPEAEPLPSAADLRVAFAAPPDLSHYARIIDRPPFNEGRRRDPPPLPPAPPPPPSVDHYRLVGVVLSPNVHVALVTRLSGGDVLRLLPGDVLDGWSVVAVEKSGVRLKGPEAEAELTIPSAVSGANDK